MKALFFILFLLSLHTTVRSQSPTPNIDFEFGNTSIWHYYTGSCCPINASASTPATVDRHTLTSGPGLDSFGLFPIVAPDGGNFSLKLGNNKVGAQSEKARYYVHVPPGAVDFSLIYRFAVVLEDPGHSVSVQPRFEVRAYDSFTTGALPCFQFAYVAAATIPGFYNSTIDTTVRCRGWSTGSINLSGFSGKTVIIDFASGDCGLGAHFGYGYLDMSYGLFAIKTVACDSDSITLIGPTGFNVYKWFDSSTGVLVDTNRSTRVPKPTSPVTYMLVLEPYPGYGCPDTIYSKVLPQPHLFDGCPDTVICPGASANLSITPLDTGLTYAWTPDTSVSCPTCPTITVMPKASTTYIVTVTNGLGCVKTDTIEVVVPANILEPMPDKFICMGDNTMLSASATQVVLPLTFAWQPSPDLSCDNCPTPVASPTITSTYNVLITDAKGCTLRDTVTVMVGGMLLAPKNDLICKGNSTTLDPGIITNAHPLTYIWQPAAQLSCSDCPAPYATPLSTTVYTVTVTDTNGCSKQGTALVILDAVSVNTIPDTTLCVNFPVPLLAYGESGQAGSIKYRWEPPYGLSCADCDAPQASPAQTTTYTVTVADSACSAAASVTINIDPCDILVPTAFTPNGDGMNDFFRVVGRLGYFRDFKFSIYNRWGERVFYTEDIDAGWDGTYKGITADLGTYFYMATYTLYDKKHMMKGDFHLIR